MIKNFIDKYVNTTRPCEVSKRDNRQQAVGKSGKFGNPVAMWDGQIDYVCDIEENMWSPWLGVKGKVDFSVKVVNKLIVFVFQKCNM